MAWGSTAHRTSPDVGGCPAGNGLAALVAGGRALSPLLVVDPLATALLVHGLVQLGDGLVMVERFDRHWLLGRHRWRTALVSIHGDARSCGMAKKLAAVHGHTRLDWVLLLDPVATDVLASRPCGHCSSGRTGNPGS